MGSFIFSGDRLGFLDSSRQKLTQVGLGLALKSHHLAIAFTTTEA